MIMDAQQQCLHEPVAIFGWGVSGQGAASLLERLGVDFEVFDQGGLNIARGEFTEQDATRFGTVVYSPGFPTEHPWIARARMAGCRCLGEVDFASLYCEGPMIAVTGTNGKTTLCSFLAHALREAGVDAFAAGNIGDSLSQEIARELHHEHTIVCELSSFQTEMLNCFGAQALLWTNFSEDHIDRHGSMEAYFEAKWRLVETLQEDCMIVGESVALAAERYGKKLPAFCEVVTRDEAACIPDGSLFLCYPQQENYLIARRFWLGSGLDPALLESAARSFTLPPHRLQMIGQIGGVRFWNDSKATNFGSALAALKTFDEPVVWIGGGRSKGGDITVFASEIAERARHALLLGEVADSLEEAFVSSGVPATRCADMHEAVALAHSLAGSAGAVLFSPGFASFDMFDNYAHRGKVYEDAVLHLKKAQPNLDQSEANPPLQIKNTSET